MPLLGLAGRPTEIKNPNLSASAAKIMQSMGRLLAGPGAQGLADAFYHRALLLNEELQQPHEK